MQQSSPTGPSGRKKIEVHPLRLRLIGFLFHLFYNPFAFTYDVVSALVSRGRWRAWTRTAIPRVAGTRVLEIPCGTGNLLLDMLAAGYAPVGADLSPSMLRITRGKLRRARRPTPLVRTRVQALPFPDGTFDSIVMTFPPGFVQEPAALAELYRVLDDEGRLIWVDAGRLLPRDGWNRLIQGGVNLIEGEQHESRLMDFGSRLLEEAGFEPHFETVPDEVSVVVVATSTKRRPG